MTQTSAIEQDGLKIVRKSNGFVELYFDWSALPALDLAEQYYCVRAIPQSDHLPTEYARPSSSGPLFLHLSTGVDYQMQLLSVYHLDYSVMADRGEKLQLELVSQHENLHKLVWGDLNLDETRIEGPLGIWGDGLLHQTQAFAGPSSCLIRGRPATIALRLGDDQICEVHTNLQSIEIVRTIDYENPAPEPKMTLSTIVGPARDWKVRAEIDPVFDIRQIWKSAFEKQHSSSSTKLVGAFRFFENGVDICTIRQFGYWTEINRSLIDRIQTEEWGKAHSDPPGAIKLQLQLTSPHRELYRFTIREKQYEAPGFPDTIGFDENELRAAEEQLASINNRVAWDQSHLELVMLFQLENNWYEFQRDTAHNLRWDYSPQASTGNCRCEWILYPVDDPSQVSIILSSGTEQHPDWSPRILLQPYSHTQLVAVWDLDYRSVEKLIYDQWQVAVNDVGFYLKVHEEYLGNRTHRGDLDIHILDLFSPYQNLYFQVEPDKNFSAEIVARHFKGECALTPVSNAVVTPRLKSDQYGVGNYRCPPQWYHHSQREVLHQNGQDSANKAKVMVHLHLHSPNLFRAEPFREAYLKDVDWPIKTEQGYEVHNPPGEWVAKNCMDSWLPILRMMRTLSREGTDFQFSMDITPPVAYMLANQRFKDYMSRYLWRAQAFVRGQLALLRFKKNSHQYIYAVERYLEEIKAIDLFYNQELGKDIIGAFCELNRQGYLEISTCTATHGMPAELAAMPDLLKSQITLAARSHHRLFGERPHGIWLAENSFFPGVEQLLSSEYLNYFFVESESALQASAVPDEEEFNPIMLPGSDVIAFPRSRLGRTQVWDAELGYAGHPDFREYHFRHYGLSVKKITSKTSNEKQPYHPDQAEETAKRLAWDFYSKLSQKAHELGQRHFKTIPLITCSYDAELFGHHWWEGPVFLQELAREFFRKGDAIGMTTPSHYLVDANELPETTPNPSTWGHEAIHVRWSDPKVIWTYRELARAEEILNTYLGYGLQGKLTPWQKEMVEQMAAELIRSQSSDLTFVIISGDFEEDMQREIVKYLNYFYLLKHHIDNQIEDLSFLRFRKYENDMFPEIPAYYNI